MINNIDKSDHSNASFLSAKDRAEIDQSVEFELNNFQHKMIYFGGILNIFAGLFIILVMYDKTELKYLLLWFSALVFCDLLNCGFAYKNRHVTPDQTKSWDNARRAYHCILALMCFTWGCIVFLYTGPDIQYQLFIISFIQLGLFGLSFGTITDYTACVISNIFMILPYMTFHIYAGIRSLLVIGSFPELNLSICLNFIVLVVFLLIATYYGYKLVRKFFRLNFENIALNEKLENANKFLEQRVQERTSELKNSLQLVTYQATHDLLTDLPNQRLLVEYIDSAIQLANKENHMFAVICFSLNEIEKINDGLGHQAGDYIIKTIAQRLQKKFGNSSPVHYSVTLSRKDVFVIIIDGIQNIRGVESLAENVFSVLDEPVYTEKQVVKLTASIGISIYPRNGREIKSLLMNADAAMLRAKQQGGNSINMYKAEINADITKQLELESNLHLALENSEFMLQYQPFIDLKTGKICGMEALGRWENPSLGIISPADFIPLAEANGIIIPLGEWVLRTACLQTKEWHKLGFNTLKVSVNLSSKQLQQKNIVQTITNILHETQLDPQFLELELTESEAFQADVIPILKQFKAMGLGLSIDDFGTGYSGLRNLKLFAIDKLKIDQSFVKDVATNNDSKAIVANIIDLAKELEVIVLAEGVETKEQLAFLVEKGCDMIQGYYFSPAVHTDVFTELLKNDTRLSF